MARCISITTACALILVASALPGRAHGKVLNSVVAVVNDQVITEKELDDELKSRGKQAGRKAGDPLKRREVIEEMIDERLMDQILTKAEVEVTEDDLVRAIANVLHQNGMSIEQLRSEVSSKGMSWEAYKDQLEKHIKRVKFVNQVIGPQVKITDQDLRDYYRQNQEEFRGSIKAHLAQIFLPFENFKSEAEVETFKKKAVDIATRARRGANFADLARTNSKGAHAESGGDLGMVDVKDLPPEVAGAVKNMAAGDVSYPIAIERGLIIVKVISLPELSASDFEKLRDEIYSALYDKRIKETLRSYLQKERRKAYIAIM